MPDILVIFGITGQQGSSIASAVLADPLLSQRYSIRGITRDPSTPAAKALSARGVEVVRADQSDPSSIAAAFQGAHTVFAMTASMYVPGGMDAERTAGKSMADAAVAAGVQFLIWSTVPSPLRLGGPPVPSWDVKVDVEEYIRGLPIRSAFFAPGAFMQNFHTFESPRAGSDGELIYTHWVPPTTKYPLIDTTGDTGKYVGAMLEDPEAWAGKTLSAATRHYSVVEIVEIMSKSVGREVKYNQIPKDLWSSFIPEGIQRDTFGNMFQWISDFGYFGPKSEELVSESVGKARGKLTTLEEYFEKNPLNV